MYVKLCRCTYCQSLLSIDLWLGYVVFSLFLFCSFPSCLYHLHGIQFAFGIHSFLAAKRFNTNIEITLFSHTFAFRLYDNPPLFTDATWLCKLTISTFAGLLSQKAHPRRCFCPEMAKIMFNTVCYVSTTFCNCSLL